MQPTTLTLPLQHLQLPFFDDAHRAFAPQLDSRALVILR